MKIKHALLASSIAAITIATTSASYAADLLQVCNCTGSTLSIQGGPMPFNISPGAACKAGMRSSQKSCAPALPWLLFTNHNFTFTTPNRTIGTAKISGVSPYHVTMTLNDPNNDSAKVANDSNYKDMKKDDDYNSSLIVDLY